MTATRCHLCLHEMPPDGSNQPRWLICSTCRADLDAMTPKARMEILLALQRTMTESNRNRILEELADALREGAWEIADRIDDMSGNSDGDEWKMEG